MASYALVVLVAVIFAQGQCASPVRRSTDTSTSLQDMMETARTQLQSVSDEWNKLVGSSNLDELKSVLESKTKELETRAKSVMDELKRQYETHGSELSEQASAALAEATNHINNTLVYAKTHAPEAMDEVAAIQQRFTDAFKTTIETVFEESGKIARAAGDDAGNAHTELTNLSRNALTQTMEVMTQLHNEVQEAVKRATA